ncbi:hypothetical protein, partial [Pyrobaculum sp.]|uniref:hypothetical protein n=1 Tax=Pyrobaculum sp. TaxID=2004705 RepID=UPI003D12B6E4
KKWPYLLEHMHGDLQRAREFVSQLEQKIAGAIHMWIHNVSGRSLLCRDHVCALEVAQAVATALGKPIHMLILLDEYPLEALAKDDKLAKDTEIMLKRLAEIPGLVVHIVVTSHYNMDLAVLVNRIGRGAVEKYHSIKAFDRISLAPGFEKDAEEFVKRLACDQLDRFATHASIEMLKNGYVFRHIMAFVLGAVKGAKKRIVDNQIERDLHDAVINTLKLAVKWKPYHGPSVPDVYTEDGTCIEVKVRATAKDVNPLQHADCGKTIFLTVSPQTVGVKNEINIKTDVHQLVGGLAELKTHGGDIIYRGVLNIIAKVVAAEALQRIGVKTHESAQPAFCEKLKQLFAEKPRPSRSELMKSAVFRAIIRDVLPDVDGCVKSGRAECVDLFAKRTQEMYGKAAVRVRASTVELGDLCKEAKVA